MHSAIFAHYLFAHLFRTHHQRNSISELTRHCYLSAPVFSRDFKWYVCWQYLLWMYQLLCSWQFNFRFDDSQIVFLPFLCFQYFSTVAHITTGTRLTDTEQFLRMPFFREVGVGVTSILMPTRFGQQMNAPCQNIVLVYLLWPYMNLAIPQVPFINCVSTFIKVS